MPYVKRFLAFFAAFLLLAALPGGVSAFEPTEGLQWNQDKLGVELSGRYYFLNGEPLQLKDKGKLGNSVRDEMDLEVRYRLLENPLLIFGENSIIPEKLRLGKFECATGVSLLTNMDAPDKLNLLLECGYTIQNNIRLEAGHFGTWNIGTKNFDKWGGNLSWVGASYKLLDTGSLVLDVYGRYYYTANLPARITEENLADSRSNLVGELGTRVFWKPLPYLLLYGGLHGDMGDQKYQFESIEVAPGVRWSFGRHLLSGKGFLENMSAEVAGSYKMNLVGPTRDGTSVWFKLIWELK